MALSKLLNNKSQGPYSMPPPVLHIRVLEEKETPKVINWHFDEDSAKPKIIKRNKTVAVTDGSSVTKITLFEDLTQKLCAPQNYIIKGYRIRGGPPSYIQIEKNTTVYRSSPVEVGENLLKEAKELLNPLSKPTRLMEVKRAKGLLTVQGQITEISALKKIRSGQEEVPLRQLTLQQDQVNMPLSLWREAAVEKVHLGDTVVVTHLTAKTSSSFGDHLQSTYYTKIERVNIETKQLITEVLGVCEGPVAGSMELCIQDHGPVIINNSMWAPFEKVLEKQKLFVSLLTEGNSVKEITAVDPEE